MQYMLHNENMLYIISILLCSVRLKTNTHLLFARRNTRRKMWHLVSHNAAFIHLQHNDVACYYNDTCIIDCKSLPIHHKAISGKHPSHSLVCVLNRINLFDIEPERHKVISFQSLEKSILYTCERYFTFSDAHPCKTM
jgi:hypothetical protein